MSGARNPANAAWKQPLLWLVIGMPALVVVAGISLVFTAAGVGSTDTVADPVQRTAQIQVADLRADARAAELHLGAELRFDAAQQQVQLQLTGQGMDPGERLRLQLLHPVHSAADIRLLLHFEAGLWRAAIDLQRQHDWRLQLTDEQGEWRLQGRWQRGERRASLAPAWHSTASSP